MLFDSANLILMVNTESELDVGIYRMEIRGFPKIQQAETTTFRVIVQPNTPPVFLGKLKDHKLYIDEAIKYTLPLYKDMENEVFVKAVRYGRSHLPYFIEFDEATRTFIIDP